MQKSVIILFVLAVTALLAYTYPTPGARAFAVSTLTEESMCEAFYSSRIFDAEAKRDFLRAEMNGTAPELRQEETLTIYINELRRVRDQHTKTFSEKYSLFRRLGLI